MLGMGQDQGWECGSVDDWFRNPNCISWEGGYWFRHPDRISLGERVQACGMYQLWGSCRASRLYPCEGKVS